MQLRTTWTLFFHSATSTDWSQASYHVLGSFSTPQDFWDTHIACTSFLTGGMLFLMREGVFPLWEHPSNASGGYVSSRLPPSAIHAVWEELCVRAVGEALSQNTQVQADVNGVSVATKRGTCTVKIWVRSESALRPGCYRFPPGCGAQSAGLHKEKRLG
jgi:hypothetical protein